MTNPAFITTAYPSQIWLGRGIAIGSAIYWTLTTALYFRQAKTDAFLWKQSNFLILVTAIGSFLSCEFLVLTSSLSAPCLLSLWAAYITVPIYSFAYLLRAWRIICLKNLQKSIMSWRLPDDPADTSRDRYGIMDDRNQDRIRARLLRDRRRTSDRRMYLLLGLVFLLSLVVLCYMQAIIHEPYRFNDPLQFCPGSWHFIPAYAFIALVVGVIAPFTIYRVWRVRNPFHIRVELIITTIANVISYFLFLFFSYWGNPIPHLFRQSEAMLPALIVSQTMVIVVPSIRSWRMEKRRRDLDLLGEGWWADGTGGEFPSSRHPNRSHFHSVLISSGEFELLERAAASVFAAESTSFIRALLVLEALQDRVESKASSPSSTTSPLGSNASTLVPNDCLAKQTEDILTSFIRFESPLEVNISKEARASAERRVKVGRVGVAVFSEARAEVEDLLYTNVYPRMYLLHPSVTEHV
ncbi:hypothetical protein BJ684DRAFT_19830 [Piptocephalis cylindrospora]|uniref:RGS domain-containing protein n=1 Tax=Piptocephalis cylindrospora TaxID=1907219 RepID=A0A4P9Y647_9FUNG|nr:hypothetical protein BJ684DRAFT_19830 [Piptocephalis cylindrospora]|eukprot:RKP13701.1 hypothetical protein BJ684DRAFT_19830 [Piptocephalis cylindrospora]